MYLALYRKFRPKVFSDVVGQEHITTTICNQIMSDRIGHAYLFCGSRGTGKTSVAKIFAKAVNCENPQHGSPCGKCATCKALEQSGNMDIIEIDAASNNGVDDLRELLTKVQYQPINAKFKVYIIDEVHMLTINAFNALLKTLEEPPRHVIFILATTEVQKIPQTILSRCMRFDFRLISTNDIFETIKKIYKVEGKDAEDEALFEIAKAGEGSLRDALSVADMCLSVNQNKLTYNNVAKVIGKLESDGLSKLFEAIAKNNAGTVLSIVDNYIKDGKNVTLIAKDFYEYVRDILILNIGGNEKILNYPKEEKENMSKLAKMVKTKRLLRMIEILSNLEAQFKLVESPRIILEANLIRLADEKSDVSITALAKRVIDLEKKVDRIINQSTKEFPQQ